MFKHRVAAGWLIMPALVCAGMGALVLFQARRSVESSARLEKLEAENRELQTHAEEMARRLAVPPAEAGAAPEESTRLAAAPAVTPAQTAARLETLRLLQNTQERLASAAATIADLNARVLELDAALSGLRADNDKLTSSHAELAEKLAASGRVVEAHRAELKGRDERMVQLQMTIQALQRQSREASAKLSQAGQFSEELEELDRKRERYLRSLQRRYREVGDLYRSLSVRLEEAPETRAPGGAELSRIQNALSMAEEDLRQITALSAEAALIQKKLASR